MVNILFFSSIIEKIQKDKRISLDHKEKDVLIFKPEALEEEKRLEEVKKWLQQMSIPTNTAKSDKKAKGK